MKSQKSDEIAQNRDFMTDFAILPKWGTETKFPHSCPVVRRLLDFSCTVTDSRDCLQSSLQAKLLTIHKSIFTKYSFQPNKSLIGNHKSGNNDLHPPQKRPATVLTVRWLQSSLLLFPQCSQSRLPLLFIVILTATSRQRSPQQLTASGFLCSLH